LEGQLETTIGIYLRKRGLMLAVAESCTGGLVGHRLTNIAGSSEYFQGGVLAYSNELKERLLGVRRETLIQHGAVSRETVIEMADGVRRIAASLPEMDRILGLSISGIAGPGGATPQKPVGLVWIGLSTPTGDFAWEHQFDGDRVQVKSQAAEQALQHLADYLSGNRLQPVQVEIRSSPETKPTPVSFRWQGRTYPITDWGRRWNDESGLHVLVMANGQQTFELIQSTNGDWYLKATTLPPTYG